MRLLLTCWAGYICSHDAWLLLQRRYDVIIYDSFVNSYYKVIKAIKSYLDSVRIDYKLKTIKGNIRDNSSLRKY